MANGGHISCVECTHNRLRPGECDIFKIFEIKTKGLILCRAFQFPEQSRAKARHDFPILNHLKPGIVYWIDNNVVTSGNPVPAFSNRDTIIKGRLIDMIEYADRRRNFLEKKPPGWSQDWYIRVGGNGYRAVSVNDETPLKGFDYKGASMYFDAVVKSFENGTPSEPKKEVPERKLQSWLIKQALMNKGEIGAAIGLDKRVYKQLLFALDEVSLGDKGHPPIIRCDILAVGVDPEDKAFPVIIELKSARAQEELIS